MVAVKFLLDTRILGRGWLVVVVQIGNLDPRVGHPGLVYPRIVFEMATHVTQELRLDICPIRVARDLFYWSRWEIALPNSREPAFQLFVDTKSYDPRT